IRGTTTTSCTSRTKAPSSSATSCSGISNHICRRVADDLEERARAERVGHVFEHPLPRLKTRALVQRAIERGLELRDRSPRDAGIGREVRARRRRSERSTTPACLALRIPDNGWYVHRPRLGQRDALRFKAAEEHSDDGAVQQRTKRIGVEQSVLSV